MSEKNKGILCIISAAFFFSLMTLFVRMAGDLPTMQKTVFRNLVAAIVSWGILIKTGEKIEFKNKDNLISLFMRSIFGTMGLICNFYAIDRLNISDANMLNKLSPFFAILMSGIILKEKAHRLEWLSVFVAFTGALLVIKPGFSMSAGSSLIGLLGGFGAGVAYTFVRKLGKNGVKGPVIVMFFSMFSVIVCLPGFLLTYKPMSATQVIILLLAGVMATGGQLSITAAYTHAPAKEISVFDYTQVLFAALWGFIFFEQLPDVYSFIGYAIIITAAVIKFLHGRSK